MYMLLNKNRILENATQSTRGQRAYMFFEGEGHDYLQVFQDKLEARLFLAIRRYKGIPLDDYVEVSIDDMRTRDALEACSQFVFLKIHEAEAKEKGKAYMEFYSLDEVRQNFKNRASPPYHPTHQAMEEEQIAHNALSDQEIEVRIAEILFNGDQAQKLILDLKIYSDHIQKERKAGMNEYKALQGFGLENLPLSVLVSSQDKIFAINDIPVFFVNPLEAYLTREIEAKRGHHVDVCNLFLPEFIDLRMGFINASIERGFVAVSIGFAGQSDPSQGLDYFTSAQGVPYVNTYAHPPKILVEGFDGKPLLNSMITHKREDERISLINRFLTVQKSSAQELEDRAKCLVTSLLVPENIKPYDSSLSVITKILF